MGLCTSAESNSSCSQWLVIICICPLACDLSIFMFNDLLNDIPLLPFSLIAAGHVLLDTSLSLHNSNCSRILSVMPIAVSMDERARFEVRGFNLSESTTRYIMLSFAAPICIAIATSI